MFSDFRITEAAVEGITSLDNKMCLNLLDTAQNLEVKKIWPIYLLTS